MLAVTFLIVFPVSIQGNWFSLTLDNDIFLGTDNGYSHGLYLSWFDVDEEAERLRPSFLLRPFSWSMPDPGQDAFRVSSHTLGQTMVTPQDISVPIPLPGEVPYAGLLAYNSHFLVGNEHFADTITTTVGILGPSSGVERAQKFFHKLIGDEEPMGWDTQLKDEIVFAFSRGRVWQAWNSVDDRFDILLGSDIGLGTLESSVNASAVFRFGRGLSESFGSVLLDGTRSSNPVALPGGWFFYAGVSGGYVFNNIFLDGNTFRDSRSVDYDPWRLGLGAGFAYSWDTLTITLAVNDMDASENAKELEELTQFGTFTIAWKY